MPEKPNRAARDAKKTQGKIVEVAQQVFAEKGYPHAGLREIARRAGVAVSLIIKHFGAKATLFEEALTSALIPNEVFQADRKKFGQRLVEAVDDPDEPMLAPTMIALSLGDEEAREIIDRVVRKSILEPMTEWLGDGATTARARAILMLTTGYALLARSMESEDSSEIAGILGASLQSIVDGEKTST